MATAPAYAATPVIWAGLTPATLDTSFTAPTNVTTLGTGGASGTKVTQVDVIPVATVVAGVVNIFAYDGTTYHLIDSATITAATVSTTAGSSQFKQTFYYDNLVLPSNAWSLRCTTTIAGNQALHKVIAYGASL